MIMSFYMSIKKNSFFLPTFHPKYIKCILLNKYNFHAVPMHTYVQRYYFGFLLSSSIISDKCMVFLERMGKKKKVA